MAVLKVLAIWRPIESAPKDGRLVNLGWLVNGVVEHSVVSQWSGDQWQGFWTPTHWRSINEWANEEPR
jgi:hypothetical protein